MSKTKTKETYLLFETAAGYSLVLVKEWDSIAQDVERVQTALKDASSFGQQVVPRGWLPFKNAEEALENMNAIKDGTPTDSLKAFLEQTLPSKKKKYQLGVCDMELAKNLAKEIDINVVYGKDVFEIVRCCRMHLKRIVPSLDDDTSRVFQVGLGHAFSRSKIKSDPARQDKCAQQAIALIDMLEKAINKFAMRVKEWYGWHFPELLKIVNDNAKFAECVLLIRTRDSFNFEKNRSSLMEILDNAEELVEQIGAALKSTMGQDIVEADMFNIENFARQVIKTAAQRKALLGYLGDKMTLVAPNLKNLTGETLAARLITQAGGLTNLAKAPSSTIQVTIYAFELLDLLQILGAEKALFRALKARGPTPKYGILFQSSFIGRATPKNKGRISRFLANKIAMASRIDAFTPDFAVNAGFYGDFLREQVEERLKYLAEGITPRKNVEVMKLACKKTYAKNP
eukprot:Gregarina_sp_Poly_1__10889@NODE_84_length_15393_cov_100_561529_g72_i0_p2_GENE_NODE_84_length_15393_cov_100_561529_g72_i0NODE_84_length_15393_cov_100_561529_g72_i0_p2_ORF_typecomplete_len457_score90_61Nop/PF01798_18/5_1e46Nop/PF01798_18/4_7e25NOP5NT/PF08156_13/2_3e13CKAP2_C/PF15297_6/0_23_NODE_84_length_15393_cov_100_561529_g72_i033074677